MAGLWDEIKKAVKDGYVVAAAKTEEYTKIGKVKLEILNIKRSIHKKFSEMGGRVHQLITEGSGDTVDTDETIVKLVAEVDALEADMKEKEARIEDIKEQENVKE